jgi:pimeloyl-ACP methyl ester carboxylesterase
VTTVFLTHNRVQLALHVLRNDNGDGNGNGNGDGNGDGNGNGRTLLLLHGLGEHSPSEVPEWAAAWPGPVAALDFTGHGASLSPAGGGYSAEILLADADCALAHLGDVTVVGRGLGAYVALLLAGARPRNVRGAVLCDGPGLWGGPSGPTSSSFVTLPDHTGERPDPYALIELARDLRPRDYAALFARLAVEQSGIDDPIAVAAVVRPPWLTAVVEEMGVVEATLADALVTYSV